MRSLLHRMSKQLYTLMIGFLSGQAHLLEEVGHTGFGSKWSSLRQRDALDLHCKLTTL